MTKNLTATRAAGHVRSAHKPNSARRVAIRYSLGSECMSCGLTGSWSREDVGLPHALEIGHVVGECIGGTLKPGNAGAQHNSCNDAARDAGVHDQTREVFAHLVPAAWVPTKRAQERGDVRDVPAQDDAPSADTLRAARRRAGRSF